MIGIYRIRNIVNNKCYYGSAKNIKRRWSKHKSQLKYGRHENILLQRAWNKYGGENFIFEIVELCNETELLLVEQKYLNMNPEYNIGKQASGGDNITNHPNKVNIVERIKSTIKKNNDLLSKEERKEKWRKCGEDNSNWRGGISVKYCVCGKQIAPEHKYCIKCLPRNGENNSFYNKHHTNETKKILSEQRKGKYFGNQNLRFIIDGIEYSSLGEASNKLGIPITTISWRLKSKNEKFNNYKYI
jgi:group I intron endonuclease